ncbi:MAG: CoA-transferase [Bacillota bacterium]
MKVTTLPEAVASIPDGGHLALGGFAIARNPIAFVHELIRQGKKDLTISQPIAGMDTDLLVATGAVRRLLYGGGSLDRFGPSWNVNRAIERGGVEVQEYSGLAITFRFLAGSLGIPYLPAQTMLGSEILERLCQSHPDQVLMGTCPFSGSRVMLLRALQPDVAVVVAQLADPDGNSWVFGPRWDEQQVLASERVIVLAEELVSPEWTEQHVDTVVIPGFRVSAVVPIPFAAHPTSVYRCYDYDAQHLKLYAEYARRGETRRYLDEYVLGCDHWGYLERVGGLKRMAALRADRALGYAGGENGGTVLEG